MGWSPSLAPGRGSLYLAIADALEADVAAGRLAPGEKLPTQRELARRLGIDLTTVTRAFAEAARRGLIHAEGRRGSFVRGTGGSASADLSGLDTASGMNMPPEPEDRLVRDRMLSGLAALLAERIAPLHYQPPGGAEPFRASAAAFVSRILPGTGADQMVITAGSQHALQAIGTHNSYKMAIAPNEFALVKASNPKVAGLDGATASYVDFLYALAEVR